MCNADSPSENKVCMLSDGWTSDDILSSMLTFHSFHILSFLVYQFLIYHCALKITPERCGCQIKEEQLPFSERAQLLCVGAGAHLGAEAAPSHSSFCTPALGCIVRILMCSFLYYSCILHKTAMK